MPRHFPLAAVLAVRHQKEWLEERALTAILNEANAVRFAIAHAEQDLVQHAKERADAVSQSHCAAHHQAVHARWTQIWGLKQTLLQRLQTLEQRRDEQQARYLRARSDREMMTELKARQRASWEAELLTREAKQMDDLFASRRLRE